MTIENEYTQIIGDVCNIFRDVTGADADPLKEGASIIFWVKRGWALRDFRLYIEYEWGREDRRSYYLQSAKLAPKHFLNTSPNSIQIIEERIDGIRQIEKVKKKIEERKAEGVTDDSGMKEQPFRCKCDSIIIRRFIKIPCEKTERNLKGFYWDWINRDEYESHYDYALWNGLKCMWPAWYKEKYFNEAYLEKLRQSKTDHSIFFKIFEGLENKIEETAP